MIRYLQVKVKNTTNMEFFLVRIFLNLDWIRRFTEQTSVFSPNTGKYGPEVTPYLGTFHVVSAAQKVSALHKELNFLLRIFSENMSQTLMQMSILIFCAVMPAYI